MMQEMKSILNDADHDVALKEINRLWGARRGTPDAGRLEALALAVETYEKQRYPIGKPTLEEAHCFRREQMGLPSYE